MVQLIVYGNKKSVCTQRIIILLEELQLKYEFNNIDLIDGEEKNENFLMLNPFGKVPIVKYDNKTIYESRSILRYIANNNMQEIDLTLNNSVTVDMWLEIESQHFNPLISCIVNEKLFKKWKEQDMDENTVAHALNEFSKILLIYETHLQEYKYVGGNEFSIADISHFPYLNYFLKSDKTYKSFLKEYPRVYKWFKRMSLRDSIKSILE
jgi:glutathione S-transferase